MYELRGAPAGYIAVKRIVEDGPYGRCGIMADVTAISPEHNLGVGDLRYAVLSFIKHFRRNLNTIAATDLAW